MMENKVYLITAAHVVFILDFDPKTLKDVLVPVKKLYMFLNKKAHPQGPAKEVTAETMFTSEWGYVIELCLDDEHVLKPDAYTGADACSHDIVLIRIPDKHQDSLLKYMNDKEDKGEKKLREKAEEKYKSLRGLQYS